MTIGGWATAGSSLFLFVFLVLSIPARGEDTGLISPTEAWQMAGEGDLLIIDIRTESEWRETGVPTGAGRASLFLAYGLPNLSFVEEVKALTGGDLTRPVALICAAGVRSAIADVLLDTEGFEHVYDIGEGMLGSSDGPGWLARELPIESCGDCTGS